LRALKLCQRHCDVRYLQAKFQEQCQIIHFRSRKIDLCPAAQEEYALGAEQIRDQPLAVSGLLSTKNVRDQVVNAPQTRCYLANGLLTVGNWVKVKERKKYESPLHLSKKNQSHDPSFPDLFDLQEATGSIKRLRRTINQYSIQALVTLTTPYYLETAYHLAKIMDQGSNVTTRPYDRGYKKRYW